MPDRTYLEKLLKSVYTGDNVDLKEIYRYVYSVLSEKIFEGFGARFPELHYNTPDWEKLSNLQYNAGVFAAFKNHKELIEITGLLLTEDGRRRSWKDFKKEALKIDKTYNEQWLRAEYNHAHAAARSAREWVDFERTKHLYPNLQYVAVMDSRTRELHKKWHGIILPIDHPFWDTHYPPNGWGCRCKARRTDRPVNTKGIDVDNPPPNQPMFNINFGKEGKIFSNEHRYYEIKGYENVIKQANKQLNNYLKIEILKKFENVVLYKKGIGSIIVNSKGIEKIINRNYNNPRMLHYVFNFEQILKVIKFDNKKYPPNTEEKRTRKKNILHYRKGMFKAHGKTYIVLLERDKALEKADYKLYLIKEKKKKNR